MSFRTLFFYALRGIFLGSVFCFWFGSHVLFAQPGRTEKTGVWAIPKNKDDFHVFLLMGQSNMAGFQTGAVQAGDLNAVPRVLELRGELKNDQGSKGEKYDTIQWVRAAHKIHESPLGGSTHGLGLDFAKRYLATHPGVTVGLIPMARGGGDLFNIHGRRTVRYANGIERVRFAKKSGVIRGVLWQQGEADTIPSAKSKRKQPETANAYKTRLDQLVRDLRADTDNAYLHFTTGQMSPEKWGEKKNRAYFKTVFKSLKEITKRMPGTGHADSTGLENVGIHFTRNGLIELGKRHAAAMNSIVYHGIQVGNFSFEGAGTGGALSARRLNQGGLNDWKSLHLTKNISAEKLRDLDTQTAGSITAGSGGAFVLQVVGSLGENEGVRSTSNLGLFSKGVRYDLVVGVGSPKEELPNAQPRPKWGIALWDATTGKELIKLQGTVAQGEGGKLRDQTISYQPDPNVVGHSIEIRLYSPAGVVDARTIFDDVRLLTNTP